VVKFRNYSEFGFGALKSWQECWQNGLKPLDSTVMLAGLGGLSR
jgi:hypothetical protein